VFVDFIDFGGDMFESIHEPIKPLLLDIFEVVFSLLCFLPGDLKLVGGFLKRKRFIKKTKKLYRAF